MISSHAANQTVVTTHEVGFGKSAVNGAIKKARDAGLACRGSIQNQPLFSFRRIFFSDLTREPHQHSIASHFRFHM
jgi:hypothetical protein